MLDYLLENKDIVLRARQFAVVKHRDQMRANRIDPYYKHLDQCADIARELGMNNNCIAAMYLHDTLEDTDTTKEELIKFFSKDIMYLVSDLTDYYTVEEYPGFNRQHRKKLEWIRYTRCDADVQTMKLIDMYSNSLEMQDLVLDFALLCLQERKTMVQRLKKADPRIRDRLKLVLSKVRLYIKED